MRDVAIVLAVVESRVFLMRWRSRIDIKQDLDTEEIWSDMVRNESNMTPRLRAQSEEEIVTLEGMRRAASDTLESCLGRPISKNFSVKCFLWHASHIFKSPLGIYKIMHIFVRASNTVDQTTACTTATTLFQLNTLLQVFYSLHLQ